MRKRQGSARLRRLVIQTVCTLAANANFKGFVTGKIYQGPGKQICVPGLNCYSCPGAVGACPIGALQTSLAGRSGLAFYVAGTVLLFGILLGRLVCGFVCPFGFLQDLLAKITKRKAVVPLRIDRPLRYLKFAVLIVFVLLLPVFAPGAYGAPVPYFCKLICPTGTLEGGIPLLLKNASLRSGVGALFFRKAAILAAVLLLSVFLTRPFCRYLCPLGALYGLCNRAGCYRMAVDQTCCTDCGACKTVCPMGIDVTKDANSIECIRCGACRSVCPHGAVSAAFLGKSIGKMQ